MSFPIKTEVIQVLAICDYRHLSIPEAIHPRPSLVSSRFGIWKAACEACKAAVFRVECFLDPGLFISSSQLAAIRVHRDLCLTNDQTSGSNSLVNTGSCLFPEPKPGGSLADMCTNLRSPGNVYHCGCNGPAFGWCFASSWPLSLDGDGEV